MACSRCGGALKLEDRSFGRVLRCTGCGSVWNPDVGGESVFRTPPEPVAPTGGLPPPSSSRPARDPAPTTRPPSFPAQVSRPLRHSRRRLQLFYGPPFAVTIVALVLAPVLAAADLAGSYLPYALLRFWMIGFCLYGITLARSAGGLRRLWQVVYGAIAIPFAFIRGLEVEQWAVIDFVAAACVAASALFLRTEPDDAAA